MDLIDRKAAIEAVRVMQTYKLSEGDDMLLVDQADVMTELMIMPSAEPETCAYWDRESNLCALHRPSAQPEDTIEMQESDIDDAMKLVRDARVTIPLSAEPVRCKDCKHNPKDEWFGCPMSHLSEAQRPETAWCWKAERRTDDE